MSTWSKPSLLFFCWVSWKGSLVSWEGPGHEGEILLVVAVLDTLTFTPPLTRLLIILVAEISITIVKIAAPVPMRGIFNDSKEVGLLS